MKYCVVCPGSAFDESAGDLHVIDHGHGLVTVGTNAMDLVNAAIFCGSICFITGGGPLSPFQSAIRGFVSLYGVRVLKCKDYASAAERFAALSGRVGPNIGDTSVFAASRVILALRVTLLDIEGAFDV